MLPFPSSMAALEHHIAFFQGVPPFDCAVHCNCCTLQLLPLQVGWSNFFTNVLFWALVLAGKFAFDWFALMR